MTAVNPWDLVLYVRLVYVAGALVYAVVRAKRGEVLQSEALLRRGLIWTAGIALVEALAWVSFWTSNYHYSRDTAFWLYMLTVTLEICNRASTLVLVLLVSLGFGVARATLGRGERAGVAFTVVVVAVPSSAVSSS